MVIEEWCNELLYTAYSTGWRRGSPFADLSISLASSVSNVLQSSKGSKLFGGGRSIKEKCQLPAPLERPLKDAHAWLSQAGAHARAVP